MFEFVNDPQFDGLPLVGEGHAAIAVRTECGRAARWLPGGDVMALAKFLGETFVVVGADLYRREPDGGLRPVPLAWPLLVLVPPAGEPAMYGQEGFTGRWAQVIGEQADPFDADLLADELATAKALIEAQSFDLAERDATIEALTAQLEGLTAPGEWTSADKAEWEAKVVVLEAQIAAMTRPENTTPDSPAKPAAATKKAAASTKEKSDVDKPGA